MEKKHYRTVWVSDSHLGSNGIHAEQLLSFLKNIKCDRLYLVGDIIDMWQMKRRTYWTSHCNDIVRKIIKMARDTEVIYVPGNHDEIFREYDGESFGNIKIKLSDIHECLDGRKILVTHGDQFDLMMKYSTLAKIGCFMYDWLIFANSIFNKVRQIFRMSHWSLSAFVKQNTKQVCKYVSQYETAMIEDAKRHGFDGVICGHIHHAEIKIVDGFIYCNCGDWVENCTALVETIDGKFEIINNQ